MIRTRKLVLEGFLLTLMTAVTVAILTLIGYVGRASADTQASTDTVNVNDPMSAIAQIYEFMRSGKGTAAVGVALILVVWLLRNIPIARYKAWAQTTLGGYILVYGSALLTYVGTGLAAGSSFTAMMLLNAAGAALVASGGWEHLRDIITELLKAKPTIPPAAGAVVLLLTFGAVAAPLLTTTSTGCQAVKDAGQAIVDCTKADAVALEGVALDLFALVPDWSAIEQKAESEAVTHGEQIAGCALAKVVNQWMSSKSVKRTEDTWAAHDALEHYRAKMVGGATFHTAQGDL